MSSQTTAIAYSNVAEAALYFDHVVPISVFLDNALRFFQASTPEEAAERAHLAAAPQGLLDGLLPPHLRYVASFRDDLRLLYDDGSETLIRWAENVVARKVTEPRLLGFDDWLQASAQIIERYGLSDCPIVIHPDVLPQLSSAEGVSYGFAATLCSLHLIDADKLSWDVVRELRQDEASRQKLRRLRMFFAHSYTGRDKSFIEDDLLTRIEDYENVVRDWQLETRQQAISMLLTSKWLGGAVGGSLFAALTGSTVTAIMSAIGGITIELGHVVVELGRQRHVLRKFVRDNPISYIVDAKRREQ